MEITFSKRFPILGTSRTTLRSLTKEDAPIIHFLRNDSRVNQFVNRPGTATISDAEFFILQRNLDFTHKKAIYWGIELKTTGFVIGSITLWHLDLENGRAELGYDLHPDFFNKGYMSEAAEAILNFGFSILQMKEIIAITSPENKPSQALLEKLSFERLADNEMPEDDLENGLIGYKVENV